MDQRAVDHTLYWTQAMELQGMRLLQSYERNGGEPYPFRKDTMMEELFFLTATNKARRWAEDLRSQLDDKENVDSFLRAIETAKLVRDKREHDEEYFGEMQKPEMMSHVTAPGSSTNLTVGQSVTVRRGGRHLLGEKFDVESGIAAARQLVLDLRERQHAFWDQRAKMLPAGSLDHFKAPPRLAGS